MLFLILLFLITFLCIHFYKGIKANCKIIYVLCLLFSFFSLSLLKMNFFSSLPEIFKYILSIGSTGTLSFILFTIVMYTGSLSNSFKYTKNLRAIRGELSIMGCIFLLGHSKLYGNLFFPTFFKNPESLDIFNFFSIFLSFIICLLVIPLGITSLSFIKNKISHRAWKNIQKLSYIFYTLMYLHVTLIYIEKFSKNPIEVLSYILLFVFYCILRVKKYLKESPKKSFKPLIN